MAFRDYEAVAEPRLELPIKGKMYSIPPVGIADGLKLEGAFGEDAAPMSDEEFRRAVLGSALDEMIADNIPKDAVNRAAMTALADHQQGRAVAEIMWETNAVPERLAAYMAAQKPKPASLRSSSTASAKKTPSRAAMKRTTSPKATQPRKSTAKPAASSVGPN
jgi:hypothetical protein